MKVSVIGLSGLSLFFKLDHLPNVGETILTDKLHKEYGGKGFNQAIVLANMGVNVSFLTKVGTDDSADACEEVLRKHRSGVYKDSCEGSYWYVGSSGGQGMMTLPCWKTRWKE